MKTMWFLTSMAWFFAAGVALYKGELSDMRQCVTLALVTQVLGNQYEKE